jgi:hypothetical protein
VTDLLPSPQKKRDIKKMYDGLTLIQTVTTQLQSREATLLDGRIACSSLTGAFWGEEKIVADDIEFEWAPFVAPDADIVDPELSVDFESAICKIQAGKTETLTDEERVTVEAFLKDDIVVPQEQEPEVEIDIAKVFRKTIRG